MTNIRQEEIELDALKHQARIMEQGAKSQQILYDDLHVLVLIKGQLLAMRYQLPDGQVCSILCPRFMADESSSERSR